MNRSPGRIRIVLIALLSGAALLAALATGASAAPAHHGHNGAKPRLTLSFYPRKIVYGAEGHVLLELSGAHGRVHGRVGLAGLGGNCDGAEWLNQHNHMHKHRRLPSDYCTTRHYFTLGTMTATATYYGSKKYRPATVTATFSAVKDYNKLTMSASPSSPAAAGTKTTFTSHLISDGYSTAGSPVSGTFAFRTENGPIAGCQHVELGPDDRHADPTGRCTTTLSAGTHTVTARFSGTKYFKPSRSSTTYVVTS